MFNASVKLFHIIIHRNRSDLEFLYEKQPNKKNINGSQKIPEDKMERIKPILPKLHQDKDNNPDTKKIHPEDEQNSEKPCFQSCFPGYILCKEDD